MRGVLVLLFAVFILLLSLIWHEPQGTTCASQVPASPQGAASRSCPEAGPGMQGAAHIAKSSRPSPDHASNPGRVRPPTGRTDRAKPVRSHQGVAFDGDATLATNGVSPVPTRANGSRLARPGTSRILWCALPVVAFFLIGASPVGNPQLCNVTAEQALLGVAADRTWPTPALPLEGRAKMTGGP